VLKIKTGTHNKSHDNIVIQPHQTCTCFSQYIHVCFCFLKYYFSLLWYVRQNERILKL